MTDRIIIVGGGVAGLSAALHLAPLPVLVVTAGEPATALAQGGIAAAIGADDAPALHAADTMTAGAGLTDGAVAAAITAAAPAAIAWLERLGVPFDRTADGGLALGLEAAHGRKRIVHAGGDATGRLVLETLVAAVAAEPAIRMLPHHRGVELLRDAHGAVRGLRVAGPRGARDLEARAVILATGGLGGLYAATTNPLSAVGSGLALAAAAGAALRDLEFVQFHPTAMRLGPDPMPLASEAIRGEGATLIDGAGRRFMAEVPGAELAPRDVVARAIGAEIAAGREVFLDARTALGARFAERFPAVTAACRRAGIDPATMPIPVAPAAHYHMGGIAVDGLGRSALDGLWAVGEVAATGLHGANRLASNSLLEGLVCGESAAEDIRSVMAPVTPFRPGSTAMQTELAPVKVQALRALMSRHVGVVRDEAGLLAARDALAEADGHSARVQVCRLLTEAALRRAASIGSHYRRDGLEPAAAAKAA